MTHTVEFRRAPDPTRLAEDVRAGLCKSPVEIPPKWFHDEKGSQLFDDITELPEYYPTRTEQAILHAHAADLPQVSTLVELGAGYSRKTRVLLKAVRPSLLVALDVSEEPLHDAAMRIQVDLPAMEIRGIVTDFEDDLAPLPGTGGDRMVVFLGSTIGNLSPGPRAAFLRRLHDATDPGDLFLLGADLVKDHERLVCAYDDAAGVTAAFNKNILHVLSRELGAQLDPDDFDHVAVYNEAEARIEMRLRAKRDLAVDLTGIDRRWHIAAGEEILTETSAKFRVEGLRGELAAAGFQVVTTWTDAAGDYSLTLAGRT